MTGTDPATALRCAFADLGELARHIEGARKVVMRIDRHLSDALDALEKTVQHPVQRPAPPPDAAADRRRPHRPGVPSGIDSDPELRAFILARIDAMTFPELQNAVAGAFPPDRRVRKSAIHRWWTRNRPQSNPG